MAWDGSEWDGWDDEEDELLEALVDVALAVWIAVKLATIKFMALEELEIPEKKETRYFDNAAKRIAGISETTRQSIRDKLEAGERNGLSQKEIAASVKGLFEETYKSRVETIVATEIRTATLEAQGVVWHEAGIRWVKLTDGTDDPCCSERNDTIVPTTDIPGLCHPRCTLRAHPMIGEP